MKVPSLTQVQPSSVIPDLRTGHIRILKTRDAGQTIHPSFYCTPFVYDETLRLATLVYEYMDYYHSTMEQGEVCVTWVGCVKSIEDAELLLDACLLGLFKGTMPDHPAIRLLLSLPRARELKLVDRLESNPDVRQIGAMVVQTTGISHGRECTTCRRNGTGPFDTCVNSAMKDVEDLRLLFGSYVRACGNCIYMKRAWFCSVKGYTPAKGNGIYAASGSSGVGAEPVDDDYYSMMNVLNRRRQGRLEELGGNTNELDDKESVDDLHPAAKRRRQENSSKAEGKAPAPHKSITIPDSDAPSFRETIDPAVREDVETENWEQGAGRVLTTAPARGKPGASFNNEKLAFSSKHLIPGSGSYRRQGCTIQVSEGVSFLAAHIPSGSIHKFEPDKTKMRICTLATGKLRVTVDGEPEFVIGANGMFKLSPGRGCKILNRAYVDVVLHVTSVEGAM